MTYKLVFLPLEDIGICPHIQRLGLTSRMEMSITKRVGKTAYHSTLCFDGCQQCYEEFSDNMTETINKIERKKLEPTAIGRLL